MGGDQGASLRSTPPRARRRCNGLRKSTVAGSPTKINRASAMSHAEFMDKIGSKGVELLDANGDGQIDKNEWKRVFAQLDTDGDGVVSKEEWEAAFGPGTFDC